MSEQNKIPVQPVLDTQSLLNQLNKQKYKINVDVDTTTLSKQLQSTINQTTNNLKTSKIPLEFDVTSLEDSLNRISKDITSITTLKNAFQSVNKSLD